MRAEEFGPAGVAGVVEVQSVLDEEGFIGLAGGIEKSLNVAFSPSSVSLPFLTRANVRSGFPLAPGNVMVPFSASSALILPRNGKKTLFLLAGFSASGFLSEARIVSGRVHPPTIMAADRRDRDSVFITGRLSPI